MSVVCANVDVGSWVLRGCVPLKFLKDISAVVHVTGTKDTMDVTGT